MESKRGCGAEAPAGRGVDPAAARGGYAKPGRARNDEPSRAPLALVLTTDKSPQRAPNLAQVVLAAHLRRRSVRGHAERDQRASGEAHQRRVVAKARGAERRAPQSSAPKRRSRRQMRRP